MIIRKSFKLETAHKVLNCTTHRCSHSSHGHSVIVEVFFSAKGLDNGQMILDFGLMKSTIKEFLDSFDHAYSMWVNMDQEEKDFHKKYSERWIELPFSPSAESLSLLYLFVIDKIMNATQFNNGEKSPQAISVRYHETDTGYAESFRDDLEWCNCCSLGDIKFSQGIVDEWADKEWWNKLVAEYQKPFYEQRKIFINPVIKKQTNEK